MRIIMHVATPQRLSLTESSSMPAARYPQRHEPVQHLGGPLAFDPSGSGDGLRGDWIAMCTELCLQGTILLVRLFRGRWLKPSHVRLSKNKPAPERKTASEGISSDAVLHKRQSKGCLVIASTTEPQACELPLPYRFLQHCRSKHRHSKLPDSCSIRFRLLQPSTLPHGRSYRAAPPSNQPLH